MISAYFVVSRSSGNIIRITRRERPPDDTPTVINVPVSSSSLVRYEDFLASGKDLISLQSITRQTKANSAKPQNSCRIV
ncbi:hypothetical protein [Metapseudomonas resinovorans]|uniref:Uncharacterized protein n=1 Tax=Metapseudomonas resinovorans NBRC 106553 TaxID=1245471 RepID=S6AR95_METRE|nr:hypothetical protein [Pseudomonas resinovorans]BAN46476.1 hypothetical protein PCA10_07440 [Pseudomonas resinovorans NBRC 106553]